MVEYGVLYFIQLLCNNWENQCDFIFECQNSAVVIIETIETSRRRTPLTNVLPSLKKRLKRRKKVEKKEFFKY